MKNAWSALRGAVQEFNAVLLSEDEEEEEEEEELLGEDIFADRQQKVAGASQSISSSPREDPVKELERRLHQEQQQRLFVQRRLQQAEEEAAKHTQEIVDLRNQCRLLRTAQGLSPPTSPPHGGSPPPPEGADIWFAGSRSRESSVPVADLRTAVRRLVHALRFSEGDEELPTTGLSRAQKRRSGTWRGPSFATDVDSASLSSLPGPVEIYGVSEAGSMPPDADTRNCGRVVNGVSRSDGAGGDPEAQEALMQLDAACCHVEQASGRAEWLLTEWKTLRASPSFRTAVSARLAMCLPPDQLAWLEGEAEIPSSRASTPSESPSPLLEWMAVSARIVQCLHCLSTDNSESPASSTPVLAGGGGRVMHRENGHRRLLARRQSSLRSLEDPVESACADEQLVHRFAESETDCGPAAQCDGASEKQLQEAVRLRQLLQHRISLQERRIHELEDELRSVKEAFEHQVDQTTEAVKKAEDQEAARQAQIQQQTNEALNSIRQQYDSLLHQYERLQAASRKAAQNDEAERANDPIAARAQQLECENQDLLLQVKSWQRAHADVSQSLQAASAELSEHRSYALKVDALEKELALSKKELVRMNNLQNVQNQSEMELIQSHAERDAMEAELNELRRTVESLSNAVERIQEENEAVIQTLKEEKEQAEADARQLRRKVAENAGAVIDLSGSLEELAEATAKVAVLTTSLDALQGENSALKQEIERILERQQKEQDEREYYVDRRIISEMISKHQALRGQIRRRDEVFLLICDVLQLSEEDREKIGIRTRKGPHESQDADKRLSERFIDFLNEETK
ncbi:hypothetical protein BESB_003770 [Besnoitia besnoiti]|uniref:Centrosomal protein n=1 Tax=Besnoitia besnoiti TaxID=94643 RepID=A0A2A9MP14_BESBE|nr:hypothetical protein BESB_003770 [Besnoitia besnoiti]PFH38036.1 hypothetical protein BESB_003770 [Besnoitia besnoiti]